MGATTYVQFQISNYFKYNDRLFPMPLNCPAHENKTVLLAPVLRVSYTYTFGKSSVFHDCCDSFRVFL